MLPNLGITPRKFFFEPTQTVFQEVRAIQKCCQNNYSRRCHLLQILPALGSRVIAMVRRLSIIVRRPPFLKIFFSKTAGPVKAKFHMEPQWDGGTNESLLAGSGSHDQGGRHAHIW